MQDKISVQAYRQTVACLEERWRELLLNLLPEQQGAVTEIRFRSQRPVALHFPGRTAFLAEGGTLCERPTHAAVIPSQIEMEQLIAVLCDYSVHTHAEEIKNGYITLPTGSRAGICGQAVVENGKLLNVQNITSVNIRIPREVPGVADEIVQKLLASGQGMILSGPPASGKSTMLKDLIRQLTGSRYGYRTVAVADERGELTLGREVGETADILLGYPKHIAMVQAVRTLNPEFVVCDEIGTMEEVEAVSYALGCGVKIVATLHAGSIEELKERKIAAALLASGAFDYIVQLSSSKNPCKVEKLFRVKEVI